MDGNPTFEALSAFAATWGMAYFGVIFMIVLAYAFWPTKQDQFNAAARIPLSED